MAILDADKEGYLRSEGSLIQVMGRAARHVNGHVIMYADTRTQSMEAAIREIERRRAIQEAYNQEHGITPEGIRKAIKDITDRVKAVAEPHREYEATPILKEDIARLIKDLESQMKAAARNLEFEKAALLRDRIVELKRSLDETPMPETPVRPSPENKEVVRSSLGRFYRTSRVVPRRH